MKPYQLITHMNKREKKMYCKFSVILCLNILIRLYLIKYALICIYFEVTKLTIEKTRFKIIMLIYSMKRHYQRGLSIFLCHP